MRRWNLYFITAIFLLLSASCTQTGLPATASPTFTPSQSAPPSATPTDTPTLVPSATPTPTVASTPTPRPSVAPTLPHTTVHFLSNGSRDLPYVALTFDLCQDPDLPSWFDADIVTALVQSDAPATFFLGGDWMRTHPEETVLLASYPQFELGNHSWSHPDMRELDEAAMHREIVRTQDILYQLTGRQSHLFRLPAGQYNDLVLSVVAWNGLYTIQWDVDSGDPDPTIDAERMTQVVMQRVRNGSIVLMHANGRGWNTAEALPGMIESLRAAGYTLVTVPQLIGMEPVPTRQP